MHSFEDMTIWIFLQIWLEMPIRVSKILVLGVWTPKRDWSSSRPPKGTSLAETALTCQFWCRSVYWCDLCACWRNQKKKKRQGKKLFFWCRFPINLTSGLYITACTNVQTVIIIIIIIIIITYFIAPWDPKIERCLQHRTKWVWTCRCVFKWRLNVETLSHSLMLAGKEFKRVKSN